jgi:hypothetical protein
MRKFMPYLLFPAQFLLQVSPLLAGAWAWDLRIAILTNYPALEDRFEDTQLVQKGQSTAAQYKQKADKLYDMLEEESGTAKWLCKS